MKDRFYQSAWHNNRRNHYFKFNSLKVISLLCNNCAINKNPTLKIGNAVKKHTKQAPMSSEREKNQTSIISYLNREKSFPSLLLSSKTKWSPSDASGRPETEGRTGGGRGSEAVAGYFHGRGVQPAVICATFTGRRSFPTKLRGEKRVDFNFNKQKQSAFGRITACFGKVTSHL